MDHLTNALGRLSLLAIQRDIIVLDLKVLGPQSTLVGFSYELGIDIGLSEMKGDPPPIVGGFDPEKKVLLFHRMRIRLIFINSQLRLLGVSAMK